MSSSLSLIFSILFLALCFLSSRATSFSTGSSYLPRRSILREIGNDDKNGKRVEKGDYVVELNAANFDAVLRDTPATYSIVEFFAHWSPACRNFKPHYEKVARLFNGADSVHPGIILMTRVNCALKLVEKFTVELSLYVLLSSADNGAIKEKVDMERKLFMSLDIFSLIEINTNLCDRFSVRSYPVLFWGSPFKFVAGSWEPRQENSEIRRIAVGRTADRMLNWINEQIGSSYGLDDEKFENKQLQINVADPGQMIKSESRASLIKFLQLLVIHHPSRRCRKTSAEILVNFDDLYPSQMWSTNKIPFISDGKENGHQNIQICGKSFLVDIEWVYKFSLKLKKEELIFD